MTKERVLEYTGDIKQIVGLLSTENLRLAAWCLPMTASPLESGSMSYVSAIISLGSSVVSSVILSKGGLRNS